MNNIVYHPYPVTRNLRNKAYGHRSPVIWFTGLSGSGKSTIAGKTEELLLEKGIHTYILDGDNVRSGLNQGLGFSQADREENMRRIAEVSRLFADAGVLVLSAFVSPLRKDREMVRRIVGASDFVEIFINTPLEECERRDVKGLYKKARAGEIPDFTGISAPYEAPRDPAIEIETARTGIDDAAMMIVNYLFNTLKISMHE